MMPIDENNFTFEIENVSFQMIHGELSTIKGGSETVHDNWTRSGRDLYAARPATASMRSAIVSFLITPPQSHENSCRSFLLSSKNRCASPNIAGKASVAQDRIGGGSKRGFRMIGVANLRFGHVFEMVEHHD